MSPNLPEHVSACAPRFLVTTNYPAVLVSLVQLWQPWVFVLSACRFLPACGVVLFVAFCCSRAACFSPVMCSLPASDPLVLCVACMLLALTAGTYVGDAHVVQTPHRCTPSNGPQPNSRAQLWSFPNATHMAPSPSPCLAPNSLPAPVLYFRLCAGPLLEPDSKPVLTILTQGGTERAFAEAYYTHTSTSPNYQILASLDVARAQVRRLQGGFHLGAVGSGSAGLPTVT